MVRAQLHKRHPRVTVTKKVITAHFPHPFPLRSILMKTSPLRLALPDGLFTSRL